jgi:hypothetical protein
MLLEEHKAGSSSCFVSVCLVQQHFFNRGHLAAFIPQLAMALLMSVTLFVMEL